MWVAYARGHVAGNGAVVAEAIHPSGRRRGLRYGFRAGVAYLFRHTRKLPSHSALTWMLPSQAFMDGRHPRLMSASSATALCIATNLAPAADQKDLALRPLPFPAGRQPCLVGQGP